MLQKYKKWFFYFQQRVTFWITTVSWIFLYRSSKFIAFGNVFTNFLSIYYYNKRKYCVKKHFIVKKLYEEI